MKANNRINMEGKRFGRLTVIAPDKRVGKNLYWLCRCDCGTKKSILGSNIRSNKSTSCGCFAIEVRIKNGKRNATHSMSETPTYHSWEGMIQRCSNIKDRKHPIYGGRGILVCEEWKDFNVFFKDMGVRPFGLTLERIDNNKGYFKSNCKWATRSEQNRNRRKYKWKRNRV